MEEFCSQTSHSCTHDENFEELSRSVEVVIKEQHVEKEHFSTKQHKIFKEAAAYLEERSDLLRVSVPRCHMILQ